MELYLKELISKNEDLEKLLEESKKNRENYAKKNHNYIIKSKKKRKEELNRKYPIIKLHIGKAIFPVLVAATKNNFKKNGIKIIQINKYKKICDNKPIIFAPTHIGKYDIEATYVLTKTHAKLLSGTEDRMHGTVNGLFLGLAQAVNYIDRGDKDDCNIGTKHVDRDLKNMCNAQWFIEGTWNISPNSLFYENSYSILYEAIINDAAIETVSYVQEGKDLFANFGGRFDLSPYRDDIIKIDTKIRNIENKHKNDDRYTTVLSDLYSEKKRILIIAARDFRDFMATLKYKTIEKKEKYYKKNKKGNYYYTKRESLRDNEGAAILYDAISEWPITDLLEENSYVRKINDDDHNFFDTFNSREYIKDGKKKFERISSEGKNRQYVIKK